MRPYFEKMTPFGKTLTDKQKEGVVESAEEIKRVEQQVEEAVEAVKNAGMPEEILKKKGPINSMGEDRASHRPRHLVPAPYTL